MDVLEYIRRQVIAMRRAVNMAMQDMTPELFNADTPCNANTISATFVHFINVEDNFIHKIIQGVPSLWESGTWSEKTGIPKPPSIGEDWSSFKRQHVAMQPLLDYQAAVWADTEAYLAALAPEELDRLVKFAGSERTVADMLILAVSQSISHAGEIAALKGVLGSKGLPI